jgi:hypothetical protein
MGGWGRVSDGDDLPPVLDGVPLPILAHSLYVRHG